MRGGDPGAKVGLYTAQFGVGLAIGGGLQVQADEVIGVALGLLAAGELLTRVPHQASGLLLLGRCPASSGPPMVRTDPRRSAGTAARPVNRRAGSLRPGGIPGSARRGSAIGCVASGATSGAPVAARLTRRAGGVATSVFTRSAGGSS